jgi:hypothetical protein
MGTQLFRGLVVLLKHMKSCTSLFAIAAALMATFVIGCSKHPQQHSSRTPASTSDVDIAGRLQGTWSEPASGGQNFKTTFYADGRGVTLMWPVGQPESVALRLGISWSVTNGVLIRTITDTSDHKSFGIGRVLKTPVVSLSSDQIVLGDQQKEYTIHSRSAR